MTLIHHVTWWWHHLILALLYVFYIVKAPILVLNFRHMLKSYFSFIKCNLSYLQMYCNLHVIFNIYQYFYINFHVSINDLIFFWKLRSAKANTFNFPSHFKVCAISSLFCACRHMDSRSKSCPSSLLWVSFSLDPCSVSCFSSLFFDDSVLTTLQSSLLSCA